MLSEGCDGTDRNQNDDEYFMIVESKSADASGTSKTSKKRSRAETDVKVCQDKYDWMNSGTRKSESRGRNADMFNQVATRLRGEGKVVGSCRERTEHRRDCTISIMLRAVLVLLL